MKIFTAPDQQTVRRDMGRNDVCWCGSGRKYKKCHLQEDERRSSATRSLNCGTS